MYPDDVDDVDRLFARLERVDPPADLHAQVVARTEHRARRRHIVGYGLLIASVLLAVFASFIIGQQLRTSGALALLAFIADLELLAEAPAEVALALVELVPWHLAAVVGAALVMVVVAVRLALSPSFRFESKARDAST